jgi:hypothetical protein
MARRILHSTWKSSKKTFNVMAEAGRDPGGGGDFQTREIVFCTTA